MSDRAHINTYFENVKRIADTLMREQSEQIDAMIRVLFRAWNDNSLVFILGNGGSASTASHFAADLSKTIADQPGWRGIRALTPWDNIPLISAIVNDRLKADYFTAWLDTYYRGCGVGIGISVHGGSGSDVGGQWSQNLLAGLQYIKKHGGITIGFSGFDGGPMKEFVDHCVVVPANSTPLVESFHVVLCHLIAFRLKELIAETVEAIYKTQGKQ